VPEFGEASATEWLAFVESTRLLGAVRNIFVVAARDLVLSWAAFIAPKRSGTQPGEVLHGITRPIAGRIASHAGL
jgi:hypothetical protein